MSYRVQEFLLKHVGLNEIEMTEGSRHLEVAFCHGYVTLWAICPTTGPKIKRKLAIVETGQDLFPVGEYVGTCIGETLVWHVFDLTFYTA